MNKFMEYFGAGNITGITFAVGYVFVRLNIDVIFSLAVMSAGIILFGILAIYFCSLDDKLYKRN